MSDRIFPLANTEIDSPYDEQLMFNVLTTGTEGGKEYRYEKWQYPKRTFTLAFTGRTDSDMETLWEFYRDMRGSYDTFWWENPNDSSESSTTGHGPVSNDIFATGDGSTANFYMGNKFLLPTGDCHVLLNSQTIYYDAGGDGSYVTWAETTNYTFDNETGQVTPVSTLPDGDVLKADYRFFYKVRFKESNLSKRAFAYKLYNSAMDLVQII